MVSRFAEDSAVYNEDLLYHQGESIALQPGGPGGPGGVPRIVDGIASAEVAEERLENDRIIQVRTRTAKLRAADAGELTAGARVSIGETVYHVESQSAPFCGLVQLKLVRQETAERSKAGYRK
jgi:hypothetical protein